MKKIILSIIAMSFLVLSCSTDDDTIIAEPLGDYENGIIVSAEGGPSSISFISEDFSTVENGVYFNVNNETLGVYLQSLGFNDTNAYIVTDNANTINVVNRYTFKKVGSITTGLDTPRYIAFLNGKGYVTNWGDPYDTTDDYIAIVNLETNTVEGSIPVGEGPERILIHNDKIFVSHKGGYNSNNIISVINATTKAVETITVNDNPDEIIIDNAGNLVVLSEGATLYDTNWNYIGQTNGAITKINVANNSIISTLTMDSGFNPSLMDYNNGKLYYVVSGKVYSMIDSATSLPTEPIINLTASYAYGLAVNDNKLFVTDASFTGQSDLIVYDLTSNSELDTFKVGLGASKIYFND
jgi:hypothetical protein